MSSIIVISGEEITSGTSLLKVLILTVILLLLPGGMNENGYGSTPAASVNPHRHNMGVAAVENMVSDGAQGADLLFSIPLVLLQSEVNVEELIKTGILTDDDMNPGRKNVPPSHPYNPKEDDNEAHVHLHDYSEDEHLKLRYAGIVKVAIMLLLVALVIILHLSPVVLC